MYTINNRYSEIGDKNRWLNIYFKFAGGGFDLLDSLTLSLTFARAGMTPALVMSVTSISLKLMCF